MIFDLVFYVNLISFNRKVIILLKIKKKVEVRKKQYILNFKIFKFLGAKFFSIIFIFYFYKFGFERRQKMVMWFCKYVKI